MKPYYDRDGITIYHGDCRDIMAAQWFDADLVLTDPPYGIKVNTAYGDAGRGKPSDKSTHVGRNRIAKANVYRPVIGDDQQFDPSHLLRFPKIVLWGANNYADKLPPSQSWIVWNRLSGESSTADAELAWTNLGGTVRMFTYQWNGACRQGEKHTHGLHPTQKPVALMAWVLRRCTKPGDLVFDPYMGSGPVAKACKQMGLRYIGIEIDEFYCATAIARLSQDSLQFEATA